MQGSGEEVGELIGANQELNDRFYVARQDLQMRYTLPLGTHLEHFRASPVGLLGLPPK